MRVDHPCVRGGARPPTSSSYGSPSHARGARREPRARPGGVRITSAGAGSTAAVPRRTPCPWDHPRCAGSTCPARSRLPGGRNYPRVRREHVRVTREQVAGHGSPPRARGALHPRGREVVLRGITPACAGSTTPAPPAGAPPRDHPRLRREHNGNGNCANLQVGSPPRARGALRPPRRPPVADRITPRPRGAPADQPVIGAGRGITPAWAGSTHP